MNLLPNTGLTHTPESLSVLPGGSPAFLPDAQAEAYSACARLDAQRRRKLPTCSQLMLRRLCCLIAAAATFLILRCAWSIRDGREVWQAQRSLAGWRSVDTKTSGYFVESSDPTGVCKGTFGHGGPGELFWGQDENKALFLVDEVRGVLKNVRCIVTMWLSAISTFPFIKRLQAIIGVQFFCAAELGAISVLVEGPSEKWRQSTVQVVLRKIGRIIRGVPKHISYKNKFNRVKQLNHLLLHLRDRRMFNEASLGLEERRQLLGEMMQITCTFKDLLATIIEETLFETSQSDDSGFAAACSAEERLRKLVQQRKKHLFQDRLYGPHLNALQGLIPGNVFYEKLRAQTIIESGPPPAIEIQIAELQAAMRKAETLPSEREEEKAGGLRVGVDDPDRQKPHHRRDEPRYSGCKFQYPASGCYQPESEPQHFAKWPLPAKGQLSHAACGPLLSPGGVSTKLELPLSSSGVRHYPGGWCDYPYLGSHSGLFLRQGARPMRHPPKLEFCEQKAGGGVYPNQHDVNVGVLSLEAEGVGSPEVDRGRDFEADVNQVADAVPSLESGVASLFISRCEPQEGQSLAKRSTHRWSLLRHSRSDPTNTTAISTSLEAAKSLMQRHPRPAQGSLGLSQKTPCRPLNLPPRLLRQQQARPAPRFSLEHFAYQQPAEGYFCFGKGSSGAFR